MSDINLLFQKKILAEKQLIQFANIFNLKLIDGKLSHSNIFDFESALWNRSELGISTCSNHIERFHRTLNEKTNQNQNILHRLSIVIEIISEYYYSFSQRSRRQTKKLYENMKKKLFEKNLAKKKVASIVDGILYIHIVLVLKDFLVCTLLLKGTL